MKVERVLERLGGVAEAGVLQRLTSRSRVRTALTGGLVVRDARGRYALPGADEAIRAASRLSGVLCLDSAARHHGWKVKHQPVSPAVAVPRNRKVAAERRTAVRLLYLDLDPREVDGLATDPVRTVMDCAARLPFDEALTIADSALRAGDLSRAQLLRAAERVPVRHRARCLRVAEHADGLADNPFESVLRAIALDVPGLEVRAQVRVRGIGRPDLVDRALGLVVEAESFEFHGTRRLMKRDCERYNTFVVNGWTVVRFSWEHVMFDPGYVAAVLEASVGLLHGRPLGRALDVRATRLPA